MEPSSTSRRGVRILGTGKYLPARRVTAAEIDARLSAPAGWVESKVGVRFRHFAGDETASRMGATAAEAALEDAGLSFNDIDCLVCASGTLEQPIPCTAALIQRAMGQGDSGVPAFDVNSTCLSFLAALDMMSYLVEAGRYRRVLLVSTEVASAGLNWSHRESCALFGDGAAAVVVGRSRDSGSAILGARLETYGKGAFLSAIHGGGSGFPASLYSEETRERFLFEMDGRALFKLSNQLLPDFVERLLAPLGLRIGDFDLVVPHQASRPALELVRKRLGIPAEKFMVILEDHGNTIAASIPMALHEAARRGRLRRGDRALLLGISAGVSLGGVVLDY